MRAQQPGSTYGSRRAAAPSGLGVDLAWLAIYAQLLLAWIGLWAMDPSRAIPEGLEGTGLSAWQALCLTAVEDASLPGLWAMWAVMGAAMMLPTAHHAFRDFSRIAGKAAALGDERFPQLSLLSVAAGYLAVWLGFAFVAALVQERLASAQLLDFTGASQVPWFTALLLIGAGAYQFSSLKEACVSRCRSPAMRFLASWKPGPRAAFSMGVKVGFDCLGCCWALMALAFVGGMSNLLWMGGATVLMTLEKLPAIGRQLTGPIGLGLIASGMIITAQMLFQML